ncbi:MAG: linear amide C-N hydrolase [Clostridia bacterium]|nr:linear amide C-N hydrolase [Clostridia bacterium]
MRKTLKIISYFLSVLVLFTIGFVSVRYYSEIRTLTSLKLVEGTNLYTMEFFSDYRFDEFLKTGAANNNEYYEYVNKIVDQSVNIGVNTSEVKDACSAFTFRDKNGKRYLGRNYDYTVNPVMLIVTSPEDAYKSISTVNMNCLGFNVQKAPKSLDLKLFAAPYFPTDGVNEKGISISVLQVNFSRKQKEEGKTTIGVYAVNRLVLDYADSIDKAVELIDGYNLYFDSSLQAHFFIADSEGNSALIEFVNGKTHVIKNERKYQVASNFNNTEETFDTDGYVYPEEYREWLTNSSTSAYDSEYSGYVRYDFMLDSLYNSSGILSVDDAFDLLENVASPSKLQYSVVYSMSDLQATVITDNEWDKRTTAALTKVN